MRANRSGFTLVELLVALILFVMVGGSMYSLLNVSQRVSRTQTEKAAMQGGLRTGVQLAIAEIQELWADDLLGESAITTMTDTELHYEAMRGLGITCSAPTATQLLLRDDTYTGLVRPTTGGGYGAYLFIENDTDREDDDAWRDVGTITVGVGACDDSDPAIQLTFPTAAIAGAQGIAPVRIYERMELGQVVDAGRNWLGIGKAGNPLTPLAGPLQATGLEFEYFDAQSDPTANPEDVKTIVMRLYGETERVGNVGGMSSETVLLADTVTVRVQLRNAR